LFLGAMAQIKQEMIIGVDKNVYVEPAIWTQLLRLSGHALEPKNAPRSAAMSR
jgi:hypothetical protein